jgi:zinc protease
MIFSEMSLLDKAMNLASFELLGDADLLNQEAAKYLEVTTVQIKELANKLFRKDNSSTLIYLAEKS